jgi:starvation-inducible DNA-binding protein
MPSRSRSTSPSPSTDGFTIPGVDPGAAAEVRDLLQQRLIAMADLTSTLKHVHWNVVGPHFIAVHEMLDPQYEAAAEMVDRLAERIAALGGSPTALAGAVVEQRTWDEYAVGRAPVEAHLAALDLVYDGVITDHRAAIEATESSDPVTQDLLIEQSGQLEQFQWFVRAHLESSDGHLAHEGATSERDAARRATAGTRRR